MKQNQNCNDGYHLREAIVKAKSLAGLEVLLDFGESFSEASPRTRRAWKNAAKRRNAELQALCPT